MKEEIGVEGWVAIINNLRTSGILLVVTVCTEGIYFVLELSGTLNSISFGVLDGLEKV